MEALPEVSNETITMIYDTLLTYGMQLIGALVMLLVGWTITGWIAGAVGRALRNSRRIDRTVQGFLVGIVRYGLLLVVVTAVLNQVGVETASLLAIIGTLGLAIGLAMQGTLSNVAAGVMLLLFRPYRVDDYIEAAGHAGTVKELGLFSTELATPDNVQIVLPNSAIWGSAIMNYSFHATRRVDFTLGIAYGDSIETAMQIIEGLIAEDDRILKDPAHQVVVGELADSSVNIIVRVWTESGNYWGLKFDLTRRFKEAFDAGGINIPFPQTELHVNADVAKLLKSDAA